MQKFRELLRDAAGSEGRQKAIAYEVFGGNEGTAKSELSKYLRGERGERAFEVIETVFKYGDKALIRTWFEQRFKPPDPVQSLSELGDQLDLFEAKVERLREQFSELADVIPLERFSGKR
ncbi:MAG: hypothetical protein ACE5F1_17330 [Planctomycetota bacterium]